MITRRHDRYILRQYLTALVGVLVFLTLLVVVFDLADRLDDASKAEQRLRSVGRSLFGALTAYYATFVPFLWTKLLPFASLIAAGLTFTWLARQNELAPVVTAGVPTLRLLAPVLVTGAILASLQSVERETLIPTVSRAHDDLHRLLARKGRDSRITDVPHLFDRGGGRLSMEAYDAAARRIEGASVSFRRQPSSTGPHDELDTYPVLDWDATSSSWIATRGGAISTLTEQGDNTLEIPAGSKAPLEMGPTLVELTVRQAAALGFSSAEIGALASAYPDNPKFKVLLHSQWAAPLATVVILLLGLPFVVRLSRPRVLASFLATTGLVAIYYLTDTVLNDFGARGALNPVVAAWGAHVLFGALGIVLMTTVET